MYYVYIYKDPRNNNTPFYIGKGKGPRYRHHMSPCMLKKNDYKSRIIKKIKSLGMEPTIELIACKTEQEALNLEMSLISNYGLRSNGGLLVNVSKGGDNPPKNQGVDHPKYGTGGSYRLTNTLTGESVDVTALFFWASTNKLSGSALKEIADKKIVHYTSAGNPVVRKQHKGWLCHKIPPQCN